MQGFRFHVSHKSQPFMVWRSSSPAMRLSSVAEAQLVELLFILARLALQNRPNAGDEPSWNQYPSQSLTTGLIAGSDLVIVPFSGVIKKYK